jgi:hypothetical protein
VGGERKGESFIALIDFTVEDLFYSVTNGKCREF